MQEQKHLNNCSYRLYCRNRYPAIASWRSVQTQIACHRPRVKAMKRTLRPWNSIDISRQTCAVQPHTGHPSNAQGCQQYMVVLAGQLTLSDMLPIRLHIQHGNPSRTALPLGIRFDIENSCIPQRHKFCLTRTRSFYHSLHQQHTFGSDPDTRKIQFPSPRPANKSRDRLDIHGIPELNRMGCNR